MIVIFFLNKSQLDEREYTNLLVSCRGLALRDPKKACKSVQKACKKRAKRLLVSWLLVSWLPSLGSSWLLASWLLFFSCRLLGMSAFFWVFLAACFIATGFLAAFFAAFFSVFSLRDFVHSGYCDPQRRRLLLLALALAALLLASSQIVSPPKI